MKTLLLCCALFLSPMMLPAQSFTVALTPSTQTVSVGESATYSVVITLVGGFNATIFLSVSGSNFKGTATLSATNPNPPYTGITLKIKTTIQDTGSRTFTVTGKNGGVQSSATCSITTTRNAQWAILTLPQSPGNYSSMNWKKDKEGNICLITYANGSAQRADSFYIHHFRNQRWETESFSPSLSSFDNYYKDFLYDRNGIFWCIVPKGILRYDGKFTMLYDKSNSTIPYSNFTSINLDKNGNLVLIADDYGLKTGIAIVTYDGTNWSSFYPTIYAPDGLSHTSYWSSRICIDSSNQIWIPTGYRGIAKFKNQVQETIDSKSTPPILTDRVRQVLCDKDGQMWCMYDYYGQLTTPFSHFDSTSMQHITTPTNSTLNSFFVDDNINIWVGSEEGLSRYGDNGTIWTTYNTTNSPLPGGVSPMIQDKNKNIWMVSKGQIFVFNPNGLVDIPLAPTSVEEQPTADDGITISPNPASTSFTISGADNITSVSILNTLGMEISRKSLVVSGTLEVDVSDFAAGMYFVQVRTPAGIISKPVVIVR